MNHSLQVIADYICKFYGISSDELQSESREYRLVKARQMINILAGKGKDRYIAQVINRARVTQVSSRKTITGNMRFDKELRTEYEVIKRGLLQYEISL